VECASEPETYYTISHETNDPTTIPVSPSSAIKETFGLIISDDTMIHQNLMQDDKNGEGAESGSDHGYQYQDTQVNEDSMMDGYSTETQEMVRLIVTDLVEYMISLSFQSSTGRMWILATMRLRQYLLGKRTRN
jgi:hypothetical protein